MDIKTRTIEERFVAAVLNWMRLLGEAGDLEGDLRTARYDVTDHTFQEELVSYTQKLLSEGYSDKPEWSLVALIDGIVTLEDNPFEVADSVLGKIEDAYYTAEPHLDTRSDHTRFASSMGYERYLEAPRSETLDERRMRLWGKLRGAIGQHTAKLVHADGDEGIIVVEIGDELFTVFVEKLDM